MGRCDDDEARLTDTPPSVSPCWKPAAGLMCSLGLVRSARADADEVGLDFTHKSNGPQSD